MPESFGLELARSLEPNTKPRANCRRLEQLDKYELKVHDDRSLERAQWTPTTPLIFPLI